MSKNLLLDTTFLLPYFGLDLGNINAFVDTLYEKLPKLYFAEISVYEAKFKIVSLYRKKRIPWVIVNNFGANLSVLEDSKKIIFIKYCRNVDRYVNELENKLPRKLGILDEIIVATAISFGNLLTIDEKILELKRELKEDFGLEVLSYEKFSEFGTVE
ncbi:MAG: hypothetical protein ACTSVW_06610 [Candidatus Njordarchaeales archaeon]